MSGSQIIRNRHGTPIIGIVGWKNSGKTTLASGLIATLSERGFRVASIKHAHHAFRIDDGPTDSARHRQAGARQVLVASNTRSALITEHDAPDDPDQRPNLLSLVNTLAPADVIVAEGFKGSPVAKIEVRRTASLERRPLAGGVENVIAIAADHRVADAALPVFDLSAISEIADFVLKTCRVERSC
ncbi:MAG: molybdopterin-guanine dinucleotide biosynthesis protein B [Pseudomonadota bacterium]